MGYFLPSPRGGGGDAPFRPNAWPPRDAFLILSLRREALGLPRFTEVSNPSVSLTFGHTRAEAAEPAEPAAGVGG